MSLKDYFEPKTVKETSGAPIIDTKRQKREGVDGESTFLASSHDIGDTG
jgi:hypothetical protein